MDSSHQFECHQAQLYFNKINLLNWFTLLTSALQGCSHRSALSTLKVDITETSALR